MKKDHNLTITSTNNPRVKAVLALQKRRERESRGLILIEGVREVRRAMSSGVAPCEVFICDAAAGDASVASLVAELGGLGAEVTGVDSRVYGRIAYRGGTEGIVAVAPRPERSLETLEEGGGRGPGAEPLLLVADGVEKPGNLGAMIRTADGAGMTGVIVSGGGVDLYSPNVIRASLGTVFSVPVAQAGAEEAAAWLRARRISIITSTPLAGMLYHQADYTGPCAIVAGSEDAGASQGWMAAADLKVRIPMNGVGDSLNVSASTSILAYEAVRQRHRAGGDS